MRKRTLCEYALSHRAPLIAVLLAHVLIYICSLFYALHYTVHRISYDSQQVPYALASIAAFSLVAAIFVFARFSFGYLLGFYLYNVAFGYVWLSWFSELDYDHRLGRLSAAISAIAFLVPALLVPVRFPPIPRVSGLTFDLLLTLLLALSTGVLVWSATYNFQLVPPKDILEVRQSLVFPTLLRYFMGICSSTALPFAFACFVMLRQYGRACLALCLLSAFFPITLTKTALFAPLALVILAILSSLTDARITVVLSRLLPAFVGVVLLACFGESTRSYFDVVNFRMLTIPSSAIDVYSDFFANHDLTYFCQVTLLKPFVSCPYMEPLGEIMKRSYGLGSFNASLFSTEGIASVGLWFAPVVVCACGFLVAAGSGMAEGLPPRFVLLSGALLSQALVDVPLATGLLTHGGALLFLLWYLTPRGIFEPDRLVRGPDLQVCKP